MSSRGSVLTLMGKFYRLIVYDFSHITSLIALALMLAFTFFNSIGRYLFQSPIPGSIDIVTYLLMPVIIWIYAVNLQYNEGKSYGDYVDEDTVDVSREEGNITVDFLANRFDDSTNEIIKLLYLPLIISILTGFAYISTQATLDAWYGAFWSTGAVPLPLWFPRLVVTVGVLLLVIELFRQFLVIGNKVARQPREYVRFLP